MELWREKPPRGAMNEQECKERKGEERENPERKLLLQNRKGRIGLWSRPGFPANPGHSRLFPASHLISGFIFIPAKMNLQHRDGGGGNA